jgi:gliding motility-associated-like protein
VKDTNSCNVNSKFTREVNVIVAPNANFDVTINPCSEAIDFAANGSSFDSITWNFGDNTPTVYNENPTSHIYAVPNQIYTATAIFKNTLTGCTDTVTKILTDSSFRPKEMNIANVFTPNNDGKNDCFQVYGITKECEKAEIRIFNRWGARVYFSKDLTECWNGRVDNIGPAVPEGTYFYIVDIIETPNPDYPKKINGSVNLIRSN